MNVRTETCSDVAEPHVSLYSMVEERTFVQNSDLVSTKVPLSREKKN